MAANRLGDVRFDTGADPVGVIPGGPVIGVAIAPLPRSVILRGMKFELPNAVVLARYL